MSDMPTLSETSSEEEDLHPLKVAGEVAKSVSRVTSGSLQLAVIPGLQELDGRDVEILVPLLSGEFTGEFGPGGKEATVSATLMFDNVAFLLFRLMSDFEEAMEQLRRLSGDLAPSPERLALTSEWIEKAAHSAQRMQRTLGTMAAAESGPSD